MHPSIPKCWILNHVIFRSAKQTGESQSRRRATRCWHCGLGGPQCQSSVWRILTCSDGSCVSIPRLFSIWSLISFMCLSSPSSKLLIENAGVVNADMICHLSHTLLFVRPLYQAGGHSRGWLPRLLTKSGYCWRGSLSQRGESPSPRTLGPASCVTTRTWVCINVLSSTWLCSTFLLLGVTAHIYHPGEGKRMSLKLSKYKCPPSSTNVIFHTVIFPFKLLYYGLNVYIIRLHSVRWCSYRDEDSGEARGDSAAVRMLGEDVFRPDWFREYND